MTKYPVVIVDLSLASADVKKTLLTRAHQVIIVATPLLPALRHARTLIHEIKELRGAKDGKQKAEGIDLVINMRGLASAHEVSKKDIEQAMDLKVSAEVPFAARSFIGSESESKRVLLDKDGYSLVRGTLLPLLQKLIGGAEEEAPAAKQGLLSGLLGKLRSRG